MTACAGDSAMPATAGPRSPRWRHIRVPGAGAVS
jgi:hypothetical protein